MEIFPAIDLINGKCVRLAQGDFARQTVYADDPLTVAASFEKAGARWIHVVDLDGAKDGHARQTYLLKKLASATKLNIQTGGGIRSEEDIQTRLDAGVQRIVIGSLAVQKPDLVNTWLSRFGADKIVLAFDITLDGTGTPRLLTRGWQDTSALSLWEILSRFPDVRTILCTDVTRDGLMKGPNKDLYRTLKVTAPQLDILASGGVGSLQDIQALQDLGLAGVITGKALYEKAFDLEQALALVKNGS